MNLLNSERNGRIARLAGLLIGFACTLGGVGIPGCLWAAPGAELAHSPSLEAGFTDPPETSRPRVWWHWIDGNITDDGLRLDLQWMRRIGLGGVQMFDAAYQTPQIVSHRRPYMTRGWKHTVRDAVKLAKKLGLEVAVSAAPGWSETGGPWVPPRSGMKKLVWSETRIQGGGRFAGKVELPPQVVGPFQDVVVDRGPDSFAGPPPRFTVPAVYKDIAVLAYPEADADRTMEDLHPTVTTSVGPIQSQLLWDGRFNADAVSLPTGLQDRGAWILVDFGHPQEISSASLGLAHFFNGNGFLPPRIGAVLESSADGVHYRHVVDLYDTRYQTPQGIPLLQETVSFEPRAARYFRLSLHTPEVGNVPASLLPFLGPIPKESRVTEFVLHPSPRIDRFEQKAGYFLGSGLDLTARSAERSARGIPRSEVRDLTRLMRPDGTLEWRAPAGRWVIVRVGYTLTGQTNSPAPSEATGLEVDKLSCGAVADYIQQYLKQYAAILGSSRADESGLRAVVNDSYEAGAANWTESLPEEFQRRRGYDLHPWLPTLTGRIVDNARDTERFLWDYRRTLGELLAECHYRTLHEVLERRGMLHYSEAHELSRAFIGDGMESKRFADVPMGAMWMPDTFFVPQEQFDADIRESASVAHLYGRKLVAAESFTAVGQPGFAYAYAPADLKATADREFADGVNLVVLHTSAHQPLVKGAPGVSLGPFGQWFTRNETWAELASPWITYLARSSYLLQQGHAVADILYFYGQDSNITALFGQHLPPVPEWYAFDFASADALTHLQVTQGNLVTSEGMQYRVLALDPRTRQMSLDVLRTLARLVRAGATLVGDKPQDTPSLSDDPTMFAALATDLWGDGSSGVHRAGCGRVVAGTALNDALASMEIEPDFVSEGAASGSRLRYVHRALGGAQIYFVANQLDRRERLDARFRVSGLAPELWHADSGLIEPVAYKMDTGRTVVPLELDPREAVFVVFRKPAHQQELRAEAPARAQLANISGPWTLRFERERGAPPGVELAHLQSWTSSADPGVRYFSGTGTYEVNFDVPADWISGPDRIELDLGAVKNIAAVVVNNHPVGVLWKPPFRTEISELLHAGRNSLSVRVTNLWVNRLIGDRQPNGMPVTFGTFNPYNADSPLMPSGLLGPVTLLRVSHKSSARSPSNGGSSGSQTHLNE